MIRGDSIAAYLRFALEKKYISKAEYALVGVHTALYFCGVEGENRIKTRALRFLRGLNQEQRASFDREFAQQLMRRIYPQALACWQTHRQQGRKLVLVSASTENYMRLVAQALGADALLCTHLLPDGTVSGNCKGEEKVRRIREWLLSAGIDADWPASYAYGDSKGDLPMLLLTGHPVQVNPKKKLRAAAPGMECVSWGTGNGETQGTSHL